ncbi:hypothetical protein KJ785_04450 [Patescibacteria group bacterium]|nr:hypothetical protein [Patescibacteria group bacterium]
MKKILYLLIIIFTTFFFAGMTKATEGACSSHGGVNCSVGSDWDGSVICNDDWKDSYVNYGETIECEGQISCLTSKLDSLKDKYEVNTKQTELNQIIDEIKYQTDLLVQFRSDIILPRTEQDKKDEITNKISSLNIDAQILQDEIKNKLYLVNLECSALGKDRLNQYKAEALLKKINDSNDGLKENIMDNNTLLDEILKSQKCPENSSLKEDGKCYCNDGFTNSILGKGCVSFDQRCLESTPNTHYLSFR